MSGDCLIANFDRNQFECVPCDRIFRNYDALLQHCRNASIHYHEWCDRCDRLFSSEYALQQHKSASSAHFVCQLCRKVDLRNRDQLADHCWLSHEGFCLDCNRRSKSTRAMHRQMEHSECAECGKACQNNNNLVQHLKVHAPATKACASCLETFTSASAVLLHQETNTCPGGMTVAMLRQIAWLVDDRRKAGAEGPHPSYGCFRCGLTSDKFSAVIQHAENTDCKEILQTRPILRKTIDLLVKDIPDSPPVYYAVSAFLQ